MAETVGELIRLSMWATCGDLVDVDVILTTAGAEAELIRRRPDLEGWSRRDSGLIPGLVLYVPRTPARAPWVEPSTEAAPADGRAAARLAAATPRPQAV